MLRELIYPLGQQRNLNFRRAGVSFVLAELGHEGRYLFLV
jgi:hypothetical protein